MRTDRAGFSVVEIILAMGLAGFGMMAIMATNEYFTKSTGVLTTKAEHTRMRNLVQLALSQRGKLSVGGPEVNLCGRNLLSANGTSQLFTTYVKKAKFEVGDGVELSIVNSDYFGRNTSPVVRSGENRKGEQLDYRVFLIGDFKSTSSATLNDLYSGFVVIEGTRSGLLETDRTSLTPADRPKMVGRVPIQFEISSGGSLANCISKEAEPELARGNFTVNECRVAGGTPIGTSIGTLCRFAKDIQLIPPSIPCPDGFTGDGMIAPYCDVDPNFVSYTVKIPPCPTPDFIPDPTPPGGGPDQGSLYCKHVGLTTSPPEVMAPLCPEDPANLTDPPLPGDVVLAWEEVVPNGYDPLTNSRFCKYNGTCNFPGTPGAEADGTPNCHFSKPTACPSTFIQLAPPPNLKCQYNFVPVPIANAVCPTGWTQVTSSQVAPWLQNGHILCF